MTRVDRALFGECPECGFAVRYGWEDGTRVCVNGHRWSNDPGLGDYLGAVYRSGNHASVEGHPTPTDGAIHRIAAIAGGLPRGERDV